MGKLTRTSARLIPSPRRSLRFFNLIQQAESIQRHVTNVVKKVTLGLDVHYMGHLQGLVLVPQLPRDYYSLQLLLMDYLTIRLRARDFYAVIADEGEARINYHCIEIEG